MCLYFSCVTAETRTSITMLNNSGESGHPCHVPGLRGKAQFFPMKNISYRPFIYGFYDVKACSFYPDFLQSFFLSRKNAVF